MLGEIVGIDVAGVVTEVAEDSTSPFKVGDEVFGTAMGSLADRVRVSSANLGHKPKSVSFVQAAAMPITYLTSLQALRGLIMNIYSSQNIVYRGDDTLLPQATNIRTFLSSYPSHT